MLFGNVVLNVLLKIIKTKRVAGIRSDNVGVKIIFRLSQKQNIKALFFYVRLDAAWTELDANWLTSNVCAKNRPRKFSELLGPSRSVPSKKKLMNYFRIFFYETFFKITPRNLLKKLLFYTVDSRTNGTANCGQTQNDCHLFSTLFFLTTIFLFYF